MNLVISKSFFRDIKKITEQTIKAQIDQAILSVKDAPTIRDIPKIKKMRGDKKGISYRIRVDDYRIGVTVENDLITFVVCKHRKDIYKYFP